jgi:phosphatidate cytidylyltransferase
MKTLVIRASSALVAVLAIGLLFYFYDINGLKFLCYLAAMLASRELTRMLFNDDDSLVVKIIFAILSIATFLSAVLIPLHSTLAFICISILFSCVSIVHKRNHGDLISMFLLQTKGILGFFYVGLLPAMAYRLLDIPNGKIWFLTMLAVVFMGDTFAYLTGMLWGNRKIMPSISPKKTVVGCIGGLLGSAVTGALAGMYFLPTISLFGLVVLSILTGVVAQFGDLFESMIKRIANRKDSGSIMPGHGGVLDRLDGVLFGAPMMLAGALLLQKLFDAI